MREQLQNAEQVQPSAELDQSRRDAQHTQSLHHSEHDLSSLLFTETAKQFDRAEPCNQAPDEEPCEKSDATIRPNSKNGEDSPYRKKIFRVGYARGHGYQDSESHAHIGPFLPSRLLLLRESQEHAPAHCLETLAGRRELGLL